MKQGEVVSCDDCQRARPIDQPVVELFGDRVGFGPAGKTDMFVERSDSIVCYWCMDEEVDI